MASPRQVLEKIWDWIRELLGLGLKPTKPVQQRLSGQMLLQSLPNFYWMNSTGSKKALRKIAKDCLEFGLDGVSIEVGERYAAEEYQGKGVTKGSLMDIYRNNFKRLKDVAEIMREAGLVMHCSFVNSNTRKNNEIRDDQWRTLAVQFLNTVKKDNVILLPVSEKDPRTRRSIYSTLWDAFAGAMGDNIITYASSARRGYAEVHSQRGGQVHGNGMKHKLLVVTDSGPAIRHIKGSGWQGGGVTNHQRVRDWVISAKRTGSSFILFDFGRKWDSGMARTAGRAWREA